MFFVGGLPTSILLPLLLNEKKQTKALLDAQAERFALEISSAQRVSLKQLELNDKAIALVRATDPWQFQAIQAPMASSHYTEYDPSEEADAYRIADRTSTKDELNDSLSAEEREIAASIGIFG